MKVSRLTLYCFFSSRRRHTRCYRDWSSDVCSSDPDLLAHMTRGRGVQIEVVLRVRRMLSHLRECMERFHDPPNLADAIERTTGPGSRKVAPLGQLPRGAAEAIDGAILPRLGGRERHEIRSPERAPHAFGRIRELRLQPSPKRLVEETFLLCFGQHREQRIDAGFHGTLAQQLGAEAVNRADVRFFELPERGIETFPRSEEH